jgi:ketosteroid isomerase-like protein
MRLARSLAGWGMLLGSIGVMILLPQFSGASDEHQNDQAAINKILETQQSNWNSGNVNAFLQGYWHSPDLTFSGSGGIARGWNGVLARYNKNYPDRAAMGHLDFSELEFRFLGKEAALVLGHWHLSRKQGDIGGVFSLVWQRFPEGWRIIHDHTSAVDAGK